MFPVVYIGQHSKLCTDVIDALVASDLGINSFARVPPNMEPNFI